MDVLEDDELKDLLDESKLIPKYNKEIDRESAYELLNEKIEVAEQEETREKARKETEEADRRDSSRRTKTRTTKRKSTRMNPFIKVLTSATVIRGVLGILGKMIK
jgi:hypothetical protein